MNFKELKKDFPILTRKVNGKPLTYLDNAATTQKPRQVIQAMTQFYEESNANVSRGVHKLSEEATMAFEDARETVKEFLNAESSDEIIFTKNCTEALNLVAYAWARNELREGDEIISTVMEHHSNIVPWQELRKQGVKVNFVNITSEGLLDLEHFKELLSDKTKLVTLTHASNVLGTINPVKEITRLAHEQGALVLVDAAQSVPHMPVNVQDLECDFLAFSGHKALGPTGIGVLYARKDLLDEMQPFQFGGDMIKTVKLEETTWADAPHKFEAGTPNIAEAIGLKAAIEYLQGIGMENLRRHEVELTRYALTELSKIEKVKVYGPLNAEQRSGVVSFNVEGVHSHDTATIMDLEGIAIRSGHACAQPLMEILGTSSIARISFHCYNSKEDVDAAVKAIEKVKKTMRVE